MSRPHFALAFSASARSWPHGPSVSALNTITAVSNDSAIATDTLNRLRDRPSARSAVSSEVAASWPNPISAPITAAVGNIV
ncbi:hypothetical protein G6F35_019140 [Rhizopus arrhizus]|nr:hypothetical protein G6F35_019140 [Rhizopus arrhizus]